MTAEWQELVGLVFLGWLDVKVNCQGGKTRTYSLTDSDFRLISARSQ